MRGVTPHIYGGQNEGDKGNERRRFNKDTQRLKERVRQAESRSLEKVYRHQVSYEEPFEKGGAR